jgi:hypothetical protein
MQCSAFEPPTEKDASSPTEATSGTGVTLTEPPSEELLALQEAWREHMAKWKAFFCPAPEAGWTIHQADLRH